MFRRAGSLIGLDASGRVNEATQSGDDTPETVTSSGSFGSAPMEQLKYVF